MSVIFSASVEPRKHSLFRLQFSFRKTRLCLAVSALFAPGLSFSAPVIGNGGVTSGAATIVQAGKVTNINQTTNKASINWQSFSTAPTETVNFNQPGASSITLNRVIGNERSVLDGALNATGKVFLINSNGVLFGKGSSVNTGGLVASTLNLTDADFNAGNYVFKADGGAGSVINMGTITARDDGYVALLGNAVSNQGVITATKGTVALNSGDKITLNFNGDSLLNVTLDAGTLNGLVENKQAIYADGGKVIMTAKAADELLSAQVNNSGVIQARTIADLKGSIEIYSHGGTANVAGTLDASAPISGDGGFIETSGATVNVAPGARVTTVAANGKTGEWLIDPNDFTIAASGGNMTAADVVNNLATTNFEIKTATMGTAGGNGDIFVNEALSWNTNTTLTLTAERNVNVNRAVTVAGSGAGAGLKVNAGADINVNAALAWTTANSLLLTAANDINVNAALTLPSNSSPTLTAANNINVNAPVSWSSGTLTLDAGANIHVNRIMSMTGTANFNGTTGTGLDADGSPKGLYAYWSTIDGALALGKFDVAGNGAFTLNNETYVRITSDLDGLAQVKANPGGNYIVGAEFNGSISPGNWTVPIGTEAAPFTGKFNGLGHKLQNLSTASLFGTIGSTGAVSNFGVPPGFAINTSASGTSLGMFAEINRGTLYNVYAGGGPSAGSTIASVGGLVGTNYGRIAQSFVYNLNFANAGPVAGGLVGTNASTGVIVDSAVRTATGSNSGGASYINGSAANIAYTGGFAGINEGTIARSYTLQGLNLTGDAIDSSLSSATSGGFVGLNSGTIDQSYSGTALNLNNTFLRGLNVGGFAGVNAGTGVISNSYTTTPNSQNALSNWDAGFVYRNAGTISRSYAVGNPRGTEQQYGFVFDKAGGTLTDTYWTARAPTGSALQVIDGTPGSTELNIATAAPVFASYVGFDASVWGPAKSGWPVLRNIIVTANSGARAYGAVTLSAPNSVGITLANLQAGGGTRVQGANLFADVDIVTADLATSALTLSSDYASDGKNVDAGFYDAGSIYVSPAYRNIRGGFMLITPKSLAPAGTLAVSDKVYDGTTSAAITTAPTVSTGVTDVNGNTQTLSLLAAFADKNAGDDKTVRLVLANGTNGGRAGNYLLSSTPTTTADITRKTITATATGTDKVYDGSDAASLSVVLDGKVSGDDLSLAGYTASFDDRNAGSNKQVTAPGTLLLAGTDAGNYTLQTSALPAMTASITPRVLTLSGSKPTDGTTSASASRLTGTNTVAGDTLGLSGSVTLASAAEGSQPIVDLSALTVGNPNYTLIGSVGSVLIGGEGLFLDRVASGTAAIDTSVANTTTITTSDRAVIEWLRFLVAGNETLNFVQPAATSIVLNRVTGNEQSVIAGALNANGRVFILNSNGVLFSAGSSVNAGALLASTLNLSDSNFNNGNYLFVGAGGSGSVVAAGDIVIVDGGFAALAGGNGVTHSGNLTAQGGKALLASANSLTLTLNTADSGVNGYTVSNLAGTTTAGGSVNVAATSGNGGLLETAGTSIAASDLTLDTGNNGTWSWTQQNAITIGNGGTSSGSFVGSQLASRNFTLRALDGDVTVDDGVSWLGNTTLTLDASVAASGNVNINKALTASGAGAGLALAAGTDIDINAPIALSGANASLAMKYGGDYRILTPASYSGVVPATTTGTTPSTPFIGAAAANGVANQAPPGTAYASVTLSGANAGLSMNGKAYTLVHSMDDLQTKVGGNINPDKLYALAENVAAPATPYAGAVVGTLDGTFAGLGHTIDGLKISSTSDNAGLFGTAAAGSVIRDFGLTNAAVGGRAFVGTLVGTSRADISKVYATGSVTSTAGVAGGLIGTSPGSELINGKTNFIADSFADVTVSAGRGPAGGLIGQAPSMNVFRSHATGNVTLTGSSSGGSVGGLIGEGGFGAPAGSGQPERIGIYDSYATGNVFADGSNGGQGYGGLVGFVGARDGDSFIINSFATGNVDGGFDVGGLAGRLVASPGRNITVDRSYATGHVESNNTSSLPGADSRHGAGGLIGLIASINTASVITVTNSHATGNVDGSIYTGSTGGLIGHARNRLNVDNSYATGNVTSPATTQSIGSGIFGGTGGLIGATEDLTTISNVFATGNVNGLFITGGLFGRLTGTLTNGYATGNVSGRIVTGGLVGAGGTIVSSYFGGVVTGPIETGALTGGGSIVTDSFYNASLNPGLPLTGTVGSTFTNSGGLTNQQFIQQFDGTSRQALANRAFAGQAAAEAAAAAAIAAAAAEVQRTRREDAVQRADGLVQSAQRETGTLVPTLSFGSNAPSVESRIVFTDSPGFSANVNSISVDGVKFEVENPGTAKPNTESGEGQGK